MLWFRLEVGGQTPGNMRDRTRDGIKTRSI